MRQLFINLLLCYLFLQTDCLAAQEKFNGQGHDYQPHYLDMNGDGLQNLQLQPLAKGQPGLAFTNNSNEDNIKNQTTTPYRNNTITASNQKPVVSPQSPNYSSYSSSQSIVASASASDSDGTIARVEFKLDSGSWQADTTSPYSKNFGTLSVGSHKIYYRAKDNDGAYSASTPYRSITITAPNQKPVVSPQSPNYSSYSSSQGIVASASASDSDGTIARVEFKLDSGSWQADTTSPYSKNFGTLSVGSHKIYYRAKDNDGAYSASTPYRSITITAPNQKPVVSPQSPNYSSYSSSQSIVASASASDSDGTIARVEFKLDSGSWQADTTSPYSKNFGTLSVGSHKIYYRAKDNDGAYSASTPYRSITITAPNQKPVVSPQSPNYSSYSSSQSIVASASASDSDGTIARVEFKLDSGSWQADTTSPYSKNFGTLSVGSHKIYYRAKDNDGAYSASTPYRNITITASNQKPVISPQSPNYSRYLTSQSIVASASASDNDGSITQVEFKLDSGSWQADTSSPYRKDFGTLSAGTYTIYYRAKDNGGSYSSTISHRFTVAGEVNKRPVIGGTPANTLTTGVAYLFTPTASDGDNDHLTFSVSNKPAWLTFNTSNGVLSGTPTASDVGTFSDIVITVSDGTASASLATFTIVVNALRATEGIIFIHTDNLGSPVAETDENGEVL
ncbi:Ig-like domain-containing protein [Thalassomonas haliotis]|uniref:Ig domain-containing protein n=1 Tax=Thalassomonas haliotis TaxID=485448 RepID=A0ABY7VFG6_9GAMM|nr:Ig-like domain-containing protein [Thalassomonas haliotis]WDE11755.1 putative Ig domain-containing protein [Thalassomonas haliotis]